MPTRYLGASLDDHHSRRSGYSGQIPHVPHRALTHKIVDASPAPSTEHPATLHRRRLLSIFSRMMARFYEQHERRWSMGRWECPLCQRRIVAWAWAPMLEVSAAMHEACVNRSMWDIVIYYERLAQAGYAQDVNALKFNFAP